MPVMNHGVPSLYDRPSFGSVATAASRCPGGDWVVSNKDVLSEKFEKLRPLDKGMYTMQKTCTYGAGGTIFLDEMSSASRSGPEETSFPSAVVAS